MRLRRETTLAARPPAVVPDGDERRWVLRVETHLAIAASGYSAVWYRVPGDHPTPDIQGLNPELTSLDNRMSSSITTLTRGWTYFVLGQMT